MKMGMKDLLIGYINWLAQGELPEGLDATDLEDCLINASAEAVGMPAEFEMVTTPNESRIAILEQFRDTGILVVPSPALIQEMIADCR
tara:strand:- start:4940 stop:5203 length:264 start_codon:yes stop_codon:yes gene_type:complete